VRARRNNNVHKRKPEDQNYKGKKKKTKPEITTEKCVERERWITQSSSYMAM
jgi:hypothetical protein